MAKRHEERFHSPLDLWRDAPKTHGEIAVFPTSCADYAFPLLPREQRFALVRMLGFNYVDLGLFERSEGLKPGQMTATPRKFGRQLKRDLIQAGLRASNVFLQTGLTLKDSSDNVSSAIVRSRNRKAFLLTLELCSELECTHITGLPGWLQKGVEDKEAVDRAIEEVSWRHHISAGSGIRYAIKPHVDSVCSSIATVRTFLESVPGLTLTLDYGQFVSQRISSREVHTFLPNASHIHAHGAAPRRLQIALEKSQVDFGGMIRRLHKNKYSGFVAIEYLRDSWNGCNRTDNVSETILLRNRLAEYFRPEQREVLPADGRTLDGHSQDAWSQPSPSAL
jgi:sugar phosphate isomerase/epimerase